MKNLALIAASAFAIAAASPASAALTLTGTGPGTVDTVNSGSTSTMTYGLNGNNGEWTLSGVAAETGTKTFNFDSSGFYSYFNVRAAASAFSGLITTQLYSAGPANCCSSPSNGFRYVGSVALNLVAGQEYGFRVSGSHFDSANRLQGTLAITDSTPAVPEPATWGMMLLGFGMVGFGMRRRKSKVTTNVSFA